MDTESLLIILKALFTKAIGKMITSMAKVKKSGQMVKSTKDLITWVKKMDMESTLGKMDQIIKVTGK